MNTQNPARTIVDLLTRCAIALAFTCLHVSFAQGTEPNVAKDQVFAERSGLVAVEAEHFFRQTATGKRAFYVTSRSKIPKIKPDGDSPHISGASRGAYVEILPDTRRTHSDKLIHGENFMDVGGKMAILSYKIRVTTPGRYYVWARVYSTTSEDNGLHFGLDGKWPQSGARWQTTKKNGWNWDCRQRTQSVHVGVPMQLWLDIEKAGEHELHMSMREDGVEVDQIALARDIKWRPASFKENVRAKPVSDISLQNGVLSLNAPAFIASASGYYLDKGKWLAINPDENKKASASVKFPFPSGNYDVTLMAVGESDGQSTYQVAIGGVKAGSFKCPLGEGIYEVGPKFNTTFKGIVIKNGDPIDVSSQIATLDGKEFSRARVVGLKFAPADEPTKAAVANYAGNRKKAAPPKHRPRARDGDGSVKITGELKQWHKVTLTLDGPFAHERDTSPNPFTDCRMTVTFQHESGSPSYNIAGYFAADGNAANSSAESGTKWRSYLSPDKPGTWNYRVHFVKGPRVALGESNNVIALKGFDGKSGSFEVKSTDKKGRDFRAHGRLQYVGKHYLRFAGSGKYFLKAGADAPETFLAYKDFDGTIARKSNVPLKTWRPHTKDWRSGDPTWKGGKGKGMIGALNYLSGKGCNVFSFLTYNAGGDGDNVWPFVERDDKMHYDCSKLDQWGIVFDHATASGLYLHFKLQETEMDDNRRGKGGTGNVPTALDGGRLGVQRKLYCRELVARFGHNLALNWNLGEENTQSTEEQRAMAGYISAVDPYDHNIVVHTFPGQQDSVYRPLLGKHSTFTGASLQNSDIKDTHQHTLKWVRESAKAGKPWVVAFDESGNAAHGQCPDLGYKGFEGRDRTGRMVYTEHEVRQQTLWGTLMAGGAGCEYYFGYQFVENDLNCEDWRSRDRSWDYCRIAVDFFHQQKIPFWEMENMDGLVGNPTHGNSRYCFAKVSEVYLVYLPTGGTCSLDLRKATGTYNVQWFNPRSGGGLLTGSVRAVRGGQTHALGGPPADADKDWAILVRATETDGN